MNSRFGVFACCALLATSVAWCVLGPVSAQGSSNSNSLKNSGYESIFQNTSWPRVDVVNIHPSDRYEVVISEGQFKIDGKEKKAIFVNGKMPGDPIRMKKGSKILINVKNNLEEVTSLHCHGIHFTDGYSWYDGGHLVTECGIPPGGSQMYIISPSKEQSGTYFCHSHFKGQYVDGMKFALIIETDEMIEQFVSKKKEYVADVHDWHHTPYGELLKDFINPHNPEGIEPTPDLPLVNGVIELKDKPILCTPGDEVLLRIINSSGLAQFYVFIDGHTMNVVELDGVEVNRKKAEVIRLGAAQRAAIIIPCGASDTKKLYKVRFMYDLTMFDSEPEGTHEAHMFISYDAKSSSPPIFEGAQESPELIKYLDEVLDEQKFVPRTHLPLTSSSNAVIKTIRLDVNFIVLDDFSNHGTFNEIAFTHPQVPSIYSMFTLDKDSYGVAGAYGSYTNARVFDYGDVVRIVVRNLDLGDHPFHLHGYTFQVLKDNAPITDTEDQELKDLEEQDAPRSDTVVIKAERYSVLQFVADNPGVWMFHCHVQWHFDSGLGMIIVVLPLLDGKTSPNEAFSPPPLEMIGNCKTLGMQYEGNAIALKGLDLTGEPPAPKKLPFFFYRGSGIAGIVVDILVFIAGMSVLVWHGVTRK